MKIFWPLLVSCLAAYESANFDDGCPPAPDGDENLVAQNVDDPEGCTSEDYPRAYFLKSINTRGSVESGYRGGSCGPIAN